MSIKLDPATIAAIIEAEKDYRADHGKLVRKLNKKFGEQYQLYCKQRPTKEQLMSDVVQFIQETLTTKNRQLSDTHVAESIKILQHYIDFEGVWSPRQYFTNNFAWAIPNQDGIEGILDFADNGTILSVGSGNGLWEALMRTMANDIGYDLKIVATDIHIRPDRNWINIKAVTHKSAVNSIQANTLFLCWPPYDESLFSIGEVGLEALRAFKGNKLVYIGESKGGCTAGDRFHDLLAKEWSLAKQIVIPNWAYIYDSIWLYKRTGS